MEVIMNKTLLALAVTAAAIGTQANALEVFNDGTTTASIGGHATVAFKSDETGKKAGAVVSNEKAPRINFEAITDLGNGLKADFKGEWKINMESGGENAFTTRLGYIGLTHETAGRLAVGTQWSQYYVGTAAVVDQPIAWSNDFVYENQGKLGTGRAENMIAYSNALDFGDAGSLEFGAGWQGATSGELKNWDGTKSDADFGARAQARLGYNIAGFQVNAAVNTGDVKDSATSATKKARAYAVSGKYGTFGQGLYVAATYQDAENMRKGARGLTDTKSMDSILAYAIDNGLNFIAKHEETQDSVLDLRMKSETSVSVEYPLSPRFRAFTGYKIDNQGEGSEYKKTRNDEFLLGGRFYL
jgi:predicted porin